MQAFSSYVPSALVAPDALQAIRKRFLADWSERLAQAQRGELPPVSDRRFSDAAWAASPVHLLGAHAYLLISDAMQALVQAANLNDEARQRLHFNVMQWLDAVAPDNYFFLNPQAQQKARDTGGQSLWDGMQLWWHDLQKGRLSQSDESAFELGRNIAITPGQVIYENALMQLIQYTPRTDAVYQMPLLIVPPNINKYYILDLQAHNSFVRYALDQGLAVYLISWRNPLAQDTDGIQRATWGDYVQHGVLQALEVVRAISAQSSVNALGFCVGGTLLASALAVAHAQGQQPVAALTLLTAFLDFQDTGVLRVFVDEAQAQWRDQQLGQGGLMTARELGTTFSFLRPNDLVWNYVVNSYLMGDAPKPFDLLFWNADGTNLPGPFFAWYFRQAYLENNLIKPGKLKIDGQPIDLTTLSMPTYIYASHDDHIVPWKSAYASIEHVSGPKRFVLGASGHIAGVINPPQRNRRHYWTHAAQGLTAPFTSADEWLHTAVQQEGSWWPDWAAWISTHSGPLQPAIKKAGNHDFPPIEPAPGRYVKVKAL